MKDKIIAKITNFLIMTPDKVLKLILRFFNINLRLTQYKNEKIQIYIKKYVQVKICEINKEI